MKKLKYFLVAIMSIFCVCFTFSGCAPSPYIEESLSYQTVQYLNVANQYTAVSYSFQVSIEEVGDYTLNYELYITDTDGNFIEKRNQEQTFTANYNTYTISNKINVYTTKKINVTVQNVRLTGTQTSHKYFLGDKGYAIGFGVLGAEILGGLIALFICDKKGLLKKKDK